MLRALRASRHRLHLQAVAVQANELHPPLIRQQIGLLALLEILIADPKLAALALVPGRIVDHEDCADLMAQCQQVDSHAGVEQSRTAMLEHVTEQARLPPPVDGLRVDTAVAGLQLLDTIELFHELADHGGEHRELAFQEVGRLAR
jgi:hypothetical protein